MCSCAKGWLVSVDVVMACGAEKNEFIKVTITHNNPSLLQKPLEVREANVKASNHKVCVLGLWAAQEAEGRRLVELADALESGR